MIPSSQTAPSPVAPGGAPAGNDSVVEGGRWEPEGATVPAPARRPASVGRIRATAARRRMSEMPRPVGWHSDHQPGYGRRMPPGGRDIELVARLNRGDTAAFEEIYHHYRDFVFRAARHRLRNTDDAWDVVQDTFMKLFARFPGFELTSAMSRFLSAMVDRQCRDRHARQHPTVDIDAVDAGPEPLTAPPAGGADVANLLSRLLPEQRELLTLRFVDDLSLRQLSDTLGAPVGTIKSRLHRAIVALRQKVDVGRKT